MGSGGVTALEQPITGLPRDVNRGFLLHNDFAHLWKRLSARRCRTYKSYTHARVVVVVTLVSIVENNPHLSARKHPQLYIETKRGSGVLRRIKNVPTSGVWDVD